MPQLGGDVKGLANFIPHTLANFIPHTYNREKGAFGYIVFENIFSAHFALLTGMCSNRVRLPCALRGGQCLEGGVRIFGPRRVPEA